MNKWKLQERTYNNKELKTSKKNQLKKGQKRDTLE